MSLRTQLNRTRSLERSVGAHWLLRFIGSIEEFDVKVKAEVAAGRLDPTDGPFLVVIFRRWLNEASGSAILARSS